MTDDLKDIVSTIATSHIDPASASTQHLLQAIAAAAMDVLDTQLTDAGSARRSRKVLFPSISPSLFKRAVTAAVEAEGPASCTTTKVDTINTDTDTDTDTASTTDPKMDANPLTTSAPSGTSSSQDNTRSHASPLNSSDKPVCRFPRSTRTGRLRGVDQARIVAQHRSLHEDTLHEEETVNRHYSSLPRIEGG
ncbi:hypothetical protein N0V85_006434 [Neurospora sp. IMI 360204]|nr:hypothetical protein N0V85_006434 [Neurospora sp. IMI 360204]